jgi:putative ABC transport system permease protein
MLISMAWRNVWRNARRSLITMSALALGVGGIVGLYSYRESTYRYLVADVTRGLVGHLQVHGRGYQDAPSLTTVVREPMQVEAKVLSALPGAKAERRVIGAGLAGAGEKSSPVSVLGVEAGSGLYTLTSGVEPRDGHEILVGKDLATELELKPGSELVLVSQATDGSVANDRYTVTGTFTSSSSEMDASSVVLPIASAQEFFGLGDGVHQIVVRLPVDREDVSPEVGLARSALDLSTLEALSWSEMLPEMKASMDAKRSSQSATDFIIFLIVGLGVFNAMTMSVFERTREFGVLMSVGTRPGRVLGLVLTESIWQALIGFVVGVAIAAAVLYGIGDVDLTKMIKGDMMGVRMPSKITLGIEWGSLKSAGFVAALTAILGGIFPALRAARLNPVEALRHT